MSQFGLYSLCQTVGPTGAPPNPCSCELRKSAHPTCLWPDVAVGVATPTLSLLQNSICWLSMRFAQVLTLPSAVYVPILLSLIDYWNALLGHAVCCDHPWEALFLIIAMYGFILGLWAWLAWNAFPKFGVIPLILVPPFQQNPLLRISIFACTPLRTTAHSFPTTRAPKPKTRSNGNTVSPLTIQS